MPISLVVSILVALILPLLIPLIYVLRDKRGELKPILLIMLCCAGVAIFYPLIPYLSSNLPLFGYAIGKFILFVFLPILTVFHIERWDIKTIFSNLGVRQTNLKKSVFYGLLVAAITITITVFVSVAQPFDLLPRIILFFEAFTEEFFFRGFLFLYILKKTNRKVAYSTSILSFILIHPQHFSNLFLISTIAQGILLTIVADKTENIIGPWISHGLNRFFPVIIKNVLAV